MDTGTAHAAPAAASLSAGRFKNTGSRSSGAIRSYSSSITSCRVKHNRCVPLIYIWYLQLVATHTALPATAAALPAAGSNVTGGRFTSN